jgi:hypothetical protein
MKEGDLKMVNKQAISRLFYGLSAACLIALVGFAVNARTAERKQVTARVKAPLNLAILIQDDLVSHVGNEIGVTRDFIRSLPAGSRVMVGYITTGTLQVRQPFTFDLAKAAGALRIPISHASAAPYNPYVEVLEALRKFDSGWKDENQNVVLLISDGLDTSRGFDAATVLHSIDLDRAIKEANRRGVSIYGFYAPSVGLTSRNYLLASYGQSSLNRISDETGGRAFFQGITDFVTFNSYFERFADALNRAEYREP